MVHVRTKNGALWSRRFCFVLKAAMIRQLLRKKGSSLFLLESNGLVQKWAIHHSVIAKRESVGKYGKVLDDVGVCLQFDKAQLVW